MVMTWSSFNFIKFLIHHPCRCFFPLPRQLHCILKPCSASVKCTEPITIFLCKLEGVPNVWIWWYSQKQKKSQRYTNIGIQPWKKYYQPSSSNTQLHSHNFDLEQSQLSVNHSTIPACLDMDLASSKGLHPVQNTATGVPWFWPYFVQNRTGLAPKSFKNLSRLVNTLRLK